MTGTYENNAHWAGWREDAAKTWIEFIRHDGSVVRYDSRDLSTGACLA